MCPYSCLSSRHFATSDVETRSSQPLNLRIHETHDEALIQQSSLDPDPMDVSSPPNFATHELEHPTLGLSPCEPLSSRDPNPRSLRHFIDSAIAATCPPQMDGYDSLTTFPLATWSTQILGSHLANLRVRKIP
jgi:hypothetical protein